MIRHLCLTGGALAGKPVPSRFQMGTSGEYESMKSRETLIRLKKFQVDEKRRRVAQIEGMIADFQRMSDRKSTRLNSSHIQKSRMPSSA